MTKEQLIEALDEETQCAYCIHSLVGCSGGVKDYGSGPVYPPCADSDLLDWFDIDSFLHDYPEMGVSKHD